MSEFTNNLFAPDAGFFGQDFEDADFFPADTNQPLQIDNPQAEGPQSGIVSSSTRVVDGLLGAIQVGLESAPKIIQAIKGTAPPVTNVVVRGSADFGPRPSDALLTDNRARLVDQLRRTAVIGQNLPPDQTIGRRPPPSLFAGIDDMTLFLLIGGAAILFAMNR